MNVPFLDLKAQYRSIKPEIDEAIQSVIDNTAFVMGPYLKAFEEDFARYQHLEHVVGTNSGTSALAIALLALKENATNKWPAGQWEAIVPANTFIAAAEAVVQAGGNPVFADIDPQTYNSTADHIEAVLSENTRVVLPVHLYGQPADMDPMMALAKKHDLKVVEDCAQAHGAVSKKKVEGREWRVDNVRTGLVGTFGDAAAFSFYPGKNLGAYADGGAVGTNDSTIARFIRMYRDHGSEIKYEHQFNGSTDRLSSLQAAILQVKLKHLDNWIQLRRNNAAIYKKYLDGVEGVILPHVPDWAKPVWHLFVIRVKDRVGLQKYLTEKGIGCGFHYKYPLHLMPAFSHLGYKEGDLPVVEKVMKEIISLPMFPELTEEQILYVVDHVKNFINKGEK